MAYYSQRDIRWKNKRLGICSKSTIGSAGCFITSLGNLIGERPDKINDKLTKQGGYSNGCLLNSHKAAEILGIRYLGKFYSPQGKCVAETDHYKSKGVPQHFVVYRDGKMIDPLDRKPNWRRCFYNIVSYRIFKIVNKEEMSYEKNHKKIFKAVEDFLGKDYGKNPNDRETEEIIKSLSDAKKSLERANIAFDRVKALEEAKRGLEGQNRALTTNVEELKRRIRVLEDNPAGGILQRLKKVLTDILNWRA